MKVLGIVLIGLLAGALCAQAPTPSDRYEEGVEHLRQAGKYSEEHREAEALREIEAATKLLPPTAQLYDLLGQAYVKTNDPRAVEFLRKAVELEPGSAERHLRLGEAYWNLLEYRKSLSEFQLAARLDPGSAMAHFRTGYAEQLLGNTGAAKMSLQRALQLDPELPLANLAMGHLLAGEGNREAAVPLLRKFAAARPADVDVRLELAQVYLDNRMWTDAETVLSEAERLQPGEKRVHYLLGRLYTAAGKPELAARQFARFSSLEAEEAKKKRLIRNDPPGSRQP